MASKQTLQTQVSAAFVLDVYFRMFLFVWVHLAPCVWAWFGEHHSSCADEELTEEVDTDGWNDQGDHFAFRYLPENGNVKDGLQVSLILLENLTVHRLCECPSMISLGHCHFVRRSLPQMQMHQFDQRLQEIVIVM